jgi:hypothetical protein
MSDAPAGRAGRDLEALVGHLERMLSHEVGATVESPAFVIDKVTGQRREFDVLITHPGHHGMRSGIECKDWATPVDSPVIEAFVAKCKDVGISQPLVVSSLGFTAPARTKAAAHNVRCLTLKEALEFSWLEAPGLEISRNVMLTVVGTPLIGDPTLLMHQGKRMTIHNADGSLTDFATYVPLVKAIMDRDIPFDPAKIGVTKTMRVQVEEPGKSVDFEGGPLAVPLWGVLITVEYRSEQTLLPFRLVEYRNEETGEIVTQTALVDLELSGFNSTLSIVHKGDEGAKVLITVGDAVRPAPARP